MKNSREVTTPLDIMQKSNMCPGTQKEMSEMKKKKTLLIVHYLDHLCIYHHTCCEFFE